jgi:hypothetical protein
MYPRVAIQIRAASFAGRLEALAVRFNECCPTFAKLTQKNDKRVLRNLGTCTNADEFPSSRTKCLRKNDHAPECIADGCGQRRFPSGRHLNGACGRAAFIDAGCKYLNIANAVEFHEFLRLAQRGRRLMFVRGFRKAEALLDFFQSGFFVQD